MIASILSSLGGLATAWVDGKTAVQKANAEIKLKQATGELRPDGATTRSLFPIGNI